MQTSLEFGFCCYLTLKYANNDGSTGAFINIVYAYVFSVLLLAFPIISFIFYKAKFEIVKDINYEALHFEEDYEHTIRRSVTVKDIDWK